MLLLRLPLQGLHGQREYGLEEVRAELQEWSGLGKQELVANLEAFQQELVAVAEEGELHLSLHPDDPPWGILGLPTAASTLEVCVLLPLTLTTTSQDFQHLFHELPSPR